ncbi:Aste57867_11230 [Aphanomyces stellatus]|uniref:Aste57867_11230 protein n=1 Tax=Aphanomyces stellatus TaxID=120398 RepID=A0A485KTL5_9STRA|nr:hypothetical protein As57867_011188 [Aphanomyces stellatus]VFT88096.1 Aste57867_11230 [Aphanomyces stellatus]
MWPFKKKEAKETPRQEPREVRRPANQRPPSHRDSEYDMNDLEPHRLSMNDIALTKQLASTAFGELWLGSCLGEYVTVKRLSESKSAEKECVKQFINEIKLHASLDSPNIVGFIGAAWTAPRNICMVIEYMDQGDLRNFLQQTSPASFSWPQKLQCAVEIADALVYLHNRYPPLIHRDIKSRSVFLNSKMQYKLSEFSVVHNTDETETMTAGVGTFRWMAPEVLQGGYYDAAVDVFSFGVLLSELDTHRLPYEDVRNAQGNPLPDTKIMLQVLSGDLQPTFSSTCPRRLQDLAKQCLSMDSQSRPTAMQVAYALRQMLAEQPVVTPPQKPTQVVPTPGIDQIDLMDLSMHRISTADVVIMQRLGQGSMADILLADFHGKRVAVKRLLPQRQTKTSDINCFVSEIRLVARFSCPSIVAFVGVTWTKPSDLALVTEYMDQGDLRNFLQQPSSATALSWPQKLQSAVDIAVALVYLHTLDPPVIHRDIKSRNVLLNSKMQCKVCDFGIASEFDVTETMTAGIGTYRWMAPEVLQDGHYDTAADVYSFGVVLSEVDTHRLPYEDARNAQGNPLTDTAIMAKVMLGQLQPTFSSRGPQRFQDLAKLCLSLNPESRPTAIEAVYQLKQLLADQPSVPVQRAPASRLTVAPVAPPVQQKPSVPVQRTNVPASISRPTVAVQPKPAPLVSAPSTSTTGTPTVSSSSRPEPPQPSDIVDADAFDLTSLKIYRIDRDDVRHSRKPEGRGGFGEVYFGHWNGQDVAIKKLLPEKQTNDTAVADFIAEIKLLASVQSEYVVAFKGAVWSRPMDIMLVMEWMEEGDLNHFLEFRRPEDVEWRHRLQIAHDVVQALSHVHARNIIHRDLKTRNVLLTPQLRAKLTDFGISRRVPGMHAAMTARIGTKNWMAPEVVAGGRYDKSADMYSFGVLLFVLDTHGVTPRVMTGRAAPDFESFKPETTKSATAFSKAAPFWYMDLSRKCVLADAAKRPTARQVAFELEQRLDEFYTMRMDDRSGGDNQVTSDSHTMKLV